jgi:hypothetical protein
MLQGMVEGESNNRDHLLPCVLGMSSGIDVKASLTRLMSHKLSIGFTDGSAISDSTRRSYTTKDMSNSFLEILKDLFDTDRALVLPDIASKELSLVFH